MKKVAVRNRNKDIPYHEKLVKARYAVDLQDNHTMVDMGNGYSKIVPIDETKVFRSTQVRREK